MDDDEKKYQDTREALAAFIESRGLLTQNNLDLVITAVASELCALCLIKHNHIMLSAQAEYYASSHRAWERVISGNNEERHA